MSRNWVARIKKHPQIYGELLRLEHLYCRYRYPDDETYVRHFFRKHMGRELELSNPVSFADKVQWMKLNWRDPLAAVCADKVAVRDYVTERAGKQYLNELYGVYSSADEIDVSLLPQAFVLKANHGSGWNVLCPDRNGLDWKAEKRKLNRWLKMNYYDKWREWTYKDIVPQILCEKYLGDRSRLMDFKFHCKHGEPVSASACFSRDGRRYINTYTMDWERLPVVKMVDAMDVELEKPECFMEMTDLCRKLSEPFPYVRVDLYQVEGRVLFGEMTFFPASGLVDMNPPEYNRIFGDFVDLSQMHAK